MTEQVAWPPVSPRAALLSSPSGRRKYESIYADSGRQSPIKRSATTPSLLDRLRSVRNGNDHEVIGSYGSVENDEEEDEETLQLQLAAIEAKLKLKKLQHTKAKADSVHSTPRSITGRTDARERLGERQMGVQFSRAGAQPDLEPTRVEVGLSPVRRQVEPVSQRSPGRVILGIDKGFRGADVNLCRARTIAESTLKSRNRAQFKHGKELTNTFTRSKDNCPMTGPSVGKSSAPKSFSERMADARELDRAQEFKTANIKAGRSKGFELDKDEFEAFKKAAPQDDKQNRSDWTTRHRTTYAYSRDDVVYAREQARSDDKVIKRSRTMPSLNHTSLRPSSRGGGSSNGFTENDEGSQVDSSLFEGFSNLHLSTRILPHSFLKRTIPSEKFTIYKIPDLLKVVTSPAYELPDSVGDFVVFAVIASKSGALDHKLNRGEELSVSDNDWERKWESGAQNQKKFMAFTLTDLKWTVDLYLFGTALPRYHRLSTGTVVAILNPSIMPPKKGREDTGAFSLSLNDGDDTVLEIGKAAHLGYCSATKKDGKPCQQWINSSKTDTCEWHLNQQLSKTQAKRMGVNTGTNGFGNGKGTGLSGRKNFFDKGQSDLQKRDAPSTSSTRQKGSRYDYNTGSRFYVAKSNPTGNIATDTDHDPFIDEASGSRDRDARLQKRLALQETERQIAKKLTTMNTGGAGAEYLRLKANGTSTRVPDAALSDLGSQRSALSGRANIMKPPPHADKSKKRVAENVRLSPVKKTRFITEKGIREAGRESFGVEKRAHDEDDDLDIV